jgi:hypothetical protein
MAETYTVSALQCYEYLYIINLNVANRMFGVLVYKWQRYGE